MGNKKQVFLINAGNDPGMSSIANDASFPALNVLALGTWIKENLSELEVIARDGQALPNSYNNGSIEVNPEVIKILNSLEKGSLVGISALATSYGSTLAIAEEAKKRGHITVLGNDQAAQLGKKILEKREYIDYVVGHEYGERPLEMLIEHVFNGKHKPKDIQTLVYRENDKIKGFDFSNEKHRSLLKITNPVGLYRAEKRKGSLDAFPIPDRTLYPKEHWDFFLENYESKFGKYHDKLGIPVTGVTTMNRIRGCSRQNDDICSHCELVLDISSSTPKKFWEEVRTAHKQTSANVFYEVCDSLSSFGAYVKEIADAKPKDLGFEPLFFVYAQAGELVNNPKMIDWFKEMGVFRVNLGLESMDNKTLKSMKKKPYDSVENNLKALRLLKEKNVFTYGSFILGTENETVETMNNTASWIKYLIRNDLIDDVEIQPILPLPYNHFGRYMKKIGLWQEVMDELRGKGHPEDWPLDIDMMSRKFINHFNRPGVMYEDCISVAEDIRTYAKERNVNYGSGVNKRF